MLWFQSQGSWNILLKILQYIKNIYTVDNSNKDVKALAGSEIHRPAKDPTESVLLETPQYKTN